MLFRKLTRETVAVSAAHVPPLRYAQRRFNMGDPSQLFTSPAGLMALLYGRTGSLEGKGSGTRSGGSGNSSGEGGGGTDKGGEWGTGKGAKLAQRRHRRDRHPRLRSRTTGSDGAAQAPEQGATGANAWDGEGSGGEPGEGWQKRLGRLAHTLLRSEALWLAAMVFLFSALWELLKSQKGVMREKMRNTLFTTLEVRSSQMEYAMIMEWMSRQLRNKGTRNLSLKPVTIADERQRDERRDENDAGLTPSILVPGYGMHLLHFDGVWLWITREVDSTKQHGNFAQQMDRENDVLTLTFLTRKRSVVERFLHAAADDWKEKLTSCVRIMAPDYRRWTTVTERARRPLDTLYLPQSTKDVVDEMRAFFGLRETYSRLGIPWRRGYLFEGPPGTGKSSLILAIAGELGLPVCILSLQSARMDDSTLLSHITALPPRCLLLLEDFENSILTSTKEEAANGNVSTVVNNGNGQGGVSLSALLNALDGVASTEGRLLIMTSNDVSRLPIPDALLRPGRIDRRVQFEKLTDEQLKEMQQSFVNVLRDSSNPVLNEAVKAISATVTSGDTPSPAIFQERLLDTVYTAYAAVSHEATAEPDGVAPHGSF